MAQFLVGALALGAGVAGSRAVAKSQNNAINNTVAPVATPVAPAPATAPAVPEVAGPTESSAPMADEVATVNNASAQLRERQRRLRAQNTALFDLGTSDSSASNTNSLFGQ